MSGRIARIFILATAGTALAATSGSAQRTTGPVARYWIDAETVSGLNMAGGFNPMAMMRGGGGAPQHNLHLRLASTRAATGAPKGDHFLPPAAGIPSLPLASPTDPGRAVEDRQLPDQVQRPRGRLLIFWGCGAKAGPGQPVVIDFAKVAAGQFPPNLFSTSVPVESGPRPAAGRGYGEWPNALDRRRDNRTPRTLLGAHRIAATYSPEISFDLKRDYLGPLRGQAADGAGGTVALSWQPVRDATGYYAWAVGGRGSGDGGGEVVWWTSADSQQFGAGLGDYIAPATVQRLVGQKVVMAPATTSCTVPAEVKRAAGDALITFLTAYGPEVDFSYPPRPADPKAVWNLEWTAKVRFKSTTTLFPGMPGFGAMGDDDAEEQAADDGDERRPPAKKKCRPSLGGLLGGRVC